MNHDYAHCIDFQPDCPEGCFRAQLCRDLQKQPLPRIATWSHLEGTSECAKVWHRPEDCVPSYNEPVLIEAEVGYGSLIHFYGWFEENGWHTIAKDIRIFRVLKWRHFLKKGEGCVTRIVPGK